MWIRWLFPCLDSLERLEEQKSSPTRLVPSHCSLCLLLEASLLLKVKAKKKETILCSLWGCYMKPIFFFCNPYLIFLFFLDRWHPIMDDLGLLHIPYDVWTNCYCYEWVSWWEMGSCKFSHSPSPHFSLLLFCLFWCKKKNLLFTCYSPTMIHASTRKQLEKSFWRAGDSLQSHTGFGSVLWRFLVSLCCSISFTS